MSYYYVDTGLNAGDVYLFAAAQGLAAWFHNCEKTVLGQRLGLRAEQRVHFAQSIGYPEKEYPRGLADRNDTEYFGHLSARERNQLIRTMSEIVRINQLRAVPVD